MRVPDASSLVCASLIWLAGSVANAAMSVNLQPSVPSPATVGTVVTWWVPVSDADDGALWYRFRSRRIGWGYQVVRDFSPLDSLDWTAADYDGNFELEVTVRNLATGETVVATAPYTLKSNALGGRPVVSPTAHPLVFLYSAPPCDAGSRMRVEFQSPQGLVQSTPYHPCVSGSSINFYLAGMLPESQYSVHHVIDTGDRFVNGPALSLTTGTAQELVETTVMQPAPPGSTNPIVLQSALFTYPFATDLNGNVVWYYPQILGSLTRPAAQGYFLGFPPAGDRLMEFDLTGLTVKETNVDRVNEQLAAIGAPSITAFHHEVRRLRDGKIVTLGAVEDVLTDVQGAGQVNVLGDMIIVLDEDLQVVWVWNTFDHLNTARLATLDDRCSVGVCPRTLSDSPNDWTHSNGISETEDGNLLLSIRSQDWVIKIDYQNGYGSGNILWRLGKDGDFTIQSDDPNPWFSHQHDANFEPGNPSRLMLLDNGNGRNLEDPDSHSRGQVLQLDEQTMVAKLAVNVDLGQYSFALGSAQRLPSGNYFFNAGFLSDGGAVASEVDSQGKTAFSIHTAAPCYRTWRLPDLYTPE